MKVKDLMTTDVKCCADHNTRTAQNSRNHVAPLCGQSVLSEHGRSERDGIERVAQIVAQNAQESVTILILALLVVRNYSATF